jgi:hypothetical protein
MSRLLAVLLIVSGLTAFLAVYTQGVEHAFGGALARFWKDDEPKLRWPPEPVPRRSVSEGVEREGRTLQPIGQRVRERVNRAMDEGARRHTGED